MEKENLKKWLIEQKKQGYSYQDLGKLLIEKGHDSNIVNELVNELNLEPKKEKPHILRNIFIILGVIVIIFIIIFAFNVINTRKNITFIEENLNENSNNSENKQEDFIVCGKDLDCFITASIGCKESSYTTYGNTIEIRGLRDNKCVVYREFMDDECLFEKENFTKILGNWKEGKYSTEDWSVCEQEFLIVSD